MVHFRSKRRRGTRREGPSKSIKWERVEVPKERGSAKAESKSEAQAKMKGSKTLETGETLGWGMRNGRFILSCEVPSSVDGTGHAWLFPIAIMTANL
jgi:hypothetical protein